MAPPAVLAAASPRGLSILYRVLPGRVAMLPVYAMRGVEAMLDESIDLVLCSLDFDHSRMFDLIRLVKARRADVPVVCCCVLDTQLSERGLRGMALAARQIGAADIVDLRPLRLGQGAGHAMPGSRTQVLSRLISAVLSQRPWPAAAMRP